MSSQQPLAEVFGFPVGNFEDDAVRHRRLRLCRFNNRAANCTKDKAEDPLGVCSIFDSDGSIAITCPVRFRQDWQIAEDAARFFFPDSARWTALSEIRLVDANGQSAGNLDLVLVAYDQLGRVLDFGAVEIQGVYISGNVRRVFQSYMDEPVTYLAQQSRIVHRPRADYLSSSRKRLIPQLIYKGGILHTWKKKTAVVLHKNFFDTLPELQSVDKSEADIAWLVYDLVLDSTSQKYQLTLLKQVYTTFDTALNAISRPVPGQMDDFITHLQDRLDAQSDDSNSPDTLSITELL